MCIFWISNRIMFFFKTINLLYCITWIYNSDLKKFISSDRRSLSDALFTVDILQNNNYIHGLECFHTQEIGTNISRRGSDVMLADKEWKQAVILPLVDWTHADSFLCQIFYTHAVQRHIIYLHSSLIDYQGKGLMFLGPSGIGKTTQAELWNQYRDALIINGDVVFVQETPDAFLGWGTPWHGSSPYCENTSVPVKALIVLKQAPENSIRELTGFEKVTAVSNNVFYPRWLEGGMELCLETLNHLLSALPVYELSCRPDEEAVRLTEEAVFGGRA